MAIRVRRGTNAQRLTVVLEEGEIAYTTDTKEFYVGDNVTLGGTLIGPMSISGYVPLTRSLTINGTTYDLSADRTWSVGTVTSVSGTGTVSGLTLTGSITSAGSLTLGGTLTLSSLEVTTALGFTPYDASNPSGFITSAALAGYLTAATAASTYYPLTNPSGYITGITSLDVTSALGFTPYNSSNPAGYISGISSLDVTTALGFTPYSAANPSGYISGISSLDVTTALGYTPVNKAGDTMTGNLILDADPSVALGAATKQYVDNIAAGINFHSPVNVATTTNLVATYFNGVAGFGATLTATSNGALVVDSQPMANTERVLVWQQSSGIENGIYDVFDAGSPTTPFILKRSSDADNLPPGEILYGDFALTLTGTLYGGYGFICNTPGTITLGVTSISYIQYNVAQAVSAGYGLQELTPNVLSVDGSVIATVASLGSYLTTAAAALTYYPLTNPSSFISGITGVMVTTALGYTPYNATNPAGYITGITSGDVTTALGFTPYSNTNPAGYITSAALAGYLTSALAATTYFPIPTGTTLEYLRGDGTTATFPTIPSVTPSALTKVDDTNVTLTLGGTPASALLQAVSLTLGWSGTLADSRIASAATWNAKQNALSGTGIVKSTAGTISYLTDNSSNWDTAYTNRITSLTTTGSGAATLISNVLNIPTPAAATFVSLTTTGSSGSSTLLTGVLNIPTYTLSGLGGQPLATNLTSLAALVYASASFVKMTAAGTFALDTTTYGTGTVTSVAALTLGTSGTDLSSTVATGTTTPVITLNVPTASASNRGALSAADWTTFNNKSREIYNNSTAAQSITANTVTYLTGSNVTSANIQAGTVVTWNISVTKTAAGAQAPIFTIRLGTASTTADATILTITGGTQSAAIDTGVFTIQCTFRTVGSGTSAVLVGNLSLINNLAATGLSNATKNVFATSAGFNSTTASAFLGVTVNSGTAAAWTVNQVNVKIENIL